MGSLQALQDRFHRPLVFSVKVSLGDTGEALAKAVSAVSQSGARVGEMVLASLEANRTVVYDLRVFAANDQQMAQVRKDVEAAGAKVLAMLDLAMESHRGGSCEMRSRTPIRSNTDLRIVYTPGVARVCKAIQADPSLARTYTGVANKVAIATNGTAILGLGDIGCLAGLPVMEGKSAIFWEFVKLSAEPVLIDTHDADEFINIMEKLAVGFGAVQIEDVAAPECFKITRELDKRLKIPVMHDDQHGTATIVTAGLLSALRRTGRKIGNLRCAISGAGAAGTAITELLQLAGIGDVVLVDRAGILYRGRKENMNAEKAALAERTNKDNIQGDLAAAMRGRELFIGVSQPNIVNQDMVRSMAKGPIVFALANPVSEISINDAYEAGAALAADGRMMNNALAYPGIFRGAMDTGAEDITVPMMMAAADALAGRVSGDEFLPEMMDPATHQAVAAAVRKVALGG